MQLALGALPRSAHSMLRLDSLGGRRARSRPCRPPKQLERLLSPATFWACKAAEPRHSPEKSPRPCRLQSQPTLGCQKSVQQRTSESKIRKICPPEPCHPQLRADKSTDVTARETALGPCGRGHVLLWRWPCAMTQALQSQGHLSELELEVLGVVRRRNRLVSARRARRLLEVIGGVAANHTVQIEKDGVVASTQGKALPHAHNLGSRNAPKIRAGGQDVSLQTSGRSQQCFLQARRSCIG